ncbi:MAG TPA: hypothetical protein VMI75_22760 [Polyangiaceae bacterium]|nr:hypothetical protein [Polyangiaceae bacterium]
MSEKHDKLFNLDEIDLDEDSDEEITGITIAAIVKDQKDDHDNDAISHVAVIKYVRAKHARLSKRIARIEKLIIAASGGIVVAGIAWEAFKAVYLHK